MRSPFVHRVVCSLPLRDRVARAGAQQSDTGIVSSKNGMVITTSAPASDVGAAILRKGGNAVDAAVATAFALAVTHPSAGNIGGGGFMVIRPAKGAPITIDYRERAPLAVDADDVSRLDRQDRAPAAPPPAISRPAFPARFAGSPPRTSGSASSRGRPT